MTTDDRLADGRNKDGTPDKDAQADADKLLARLDEPAFGELLAQIDAEES